MPHPVSTSLPDDIVGHVASFMSVKHLLRFSLTSQELQYGFVWDRLPAIDIHFDCNDGRKSVKFEDMDRYSATGRNVINLIASLFERGVRFKSLRRINMYLPYHEIPGFDALYPLLQHLSSERQLKSASVPFSQLDSIRHDSIEDLTAYGFSTPATIEWFQQPLAKLRSLRFLVHHTEGDEEEDCEDKVDDMSALLQSLTREQEKTLPALERISCSFDVVVNSGQAASITEHLAKIYHAKGSKIAFIGVDDDFVEILNDGLNADNEELDDNGLPISSFRGIPLSVFRLLQIYDPPISFFPRYLSELCDQFAMSTKHPRETHDVAAAKAENMRDLIHGSWRSSDYIDDLCYFSQKSSSNLILRELWYIDECTRVLKAWQADPFCSSDKILKLAILSASLMCQYRAFANEYIKSAEVLLLEWAPVLTRDIPDQCYLDQGDALSHTILRDLILESADVFRFTITLRFLAVNGELLRRLQLPSNFVAKSLRIDPFYDTAGLLSMGADPLDILTGSLGVGDPSPRYSERFHWYAEMEMLYRYMKEMPDKDAVNKRLVNIVSTASKYQLQRHLPLLVNSDFIRNPSLDSFGSVINLMEEKIVEERKRNAQVETSVAPKEAGETFICAFCKLDRQIQFGDQDPRRTSGGCQTMLIRSHPYSAERAGCTTDT